MSVTAASKTSDVDTLDLGIIHCLQLDGRLPFRRIAEVLATSEQTVARRYRRLRGDGIVRVVAVSNPAFWGQRTWMLRVQTRPESTSAVATALANRPDMSWVSIAAGGTTITGSLKVRNDEERDDLLQSRLPRHTQVLGLTVHSVLHRFGNARGFDWTVRSALVDDATAAALLGQRPGTLASSEPDPEDAPLLALLAQDGRASVADLAEQIGWPTARTARRLQGVLEANVVYLDCDVAARRVGWQAAIEVWLTVEPAHLAAVGQAVADLPDVAFAAAVTGAANLYAVALFRGGDELYGFLTEQIGPLPGIRAAETLPVLRQVKQSGSFVVGERLTGIPPTK